MDPLSLQTVMKMMIALGTVLLVFGATIFVFKKLSNRGSLFSKKLGRQKAKAIDVVAFHNLGPGKSVYILKCMDRNIVVGVTAQNIQFLCDVESNQEADEAEVAFESNLTEHMPHETERKFRESIAKKFQDITRV
jgi:flagellar biogenesis protein FliO